MTLRGRPMGCLTASPANTVPRPALGNNAPTLPRRPRERWLGRWTASWRWVSSPTRHRATSSKNKKSNAATRRQATCCCVHEQGVKQGDKNGGILMEVRTEKGQCLEVVSVWQCCCRVYDRRLHSAGAWNQELRSVPCFAKDILSDKTINSSASGKMGFSEDDLNQCIYTVVRLLHRFDFKPLQTLCLWMLVFGQDVSTCLHIGCWLVCACCWPRRYTDRIWGKWSAIYGEPFQVTHICRFPPLSDNDWSKCIQSERKWIAPFTQLEAWLPSVVNLKSDSWDRWEEELFHVFGDQMDV